MSAYTTVWDCHQYHLLHCKRIQTLKVSNGYNDKASGGVHLNRCTKGSKEFFMGHKREKKHPEACESRTKLTPKETVDRFERNSNGGPSVVGRQPFGR